MKEMYAVPFWDVSTPSFVSFYIEYFGTDEDIAEFAAACRKSGCHEEFLRGYDELMGGNSDATINIAYSDMPIKSPVELLGRSESLTSDMCWETLNTWDCPYTLKAEKMQREVIWIKHCDSFIRAARYRIKGLMLRGLSDFSPISNRWGNDEVIAFEEGSDTDCRSLFYFPERYFSSEEECRSDMSAPEFVPENDLRRLCFEFFADG